MYRLKYKGKLNILNIHRCSNLLNCKDRNDFLLMADFFHSFLDINMVPHFAGLHVKNANQQSEVSATGPLLMQVVREHQCK